MAEPKKKPDKPYKPGLRKVVDGEPVKETGKKYVPGTRRITSKK